MRPMHAGTARRRAPTAARTALVAVLAAAAFAGCTAPDAYRAAQGWRRSTCDGIVDAERRAACLERADTDAATYERERAATRR